MADKSKLIKEAQKYLSKGQIDKAISSWEKIAITYPEGNTFNFIGDLHLKKGDRQVAIEQFHKAAKIFLEEGFTLKGLAIYKKILNVNSHDAGALIALGQINEDKKITTDAIKYYLAAADVLAKENRRNDLLAVYKRIVSLAPSNIQLKSKIAETLSNNGFVREAAEQFVDLGRLHEDEGDAEQAIRYYKKSSELAPSNKTSLIALSNLYEKDGKLDEASRCIDVAIERTGEDAKLLMRRAQLLSSSGELDKALECLQKVAEKDPDILEVRRQLAELHLKAGRMQEAWDEYLTVLDVLTAEAKFDEVANILEDFRQDRPVECGRKLAAVYRQAGNDELAFNELVRLAEIHKEQDEQEEYLECLREASGIRPENLEIREKINAIEDEIAPELRAPKLSEAEEPEASMEAVAEAAEDAGYEAPEEALDTGTPEMKPASFEEPLEEAGQPHEQAGGPESAEEPAAPPFEAPTGERSVEALLSEADIFIKHGMLEDAHALLESLKVKEPENLGVHQRLKSLYEETGDVEQGVTECIVLSTLCARANDEENKRAYLKEAFRLNPNDPRLEGRAVEAGIEEPEPEAETVGAVEHASAAEAALSDPLEEAASPQEGPASADEVSAVESGQKDETDVPQMEALDIQDFQEPELDSDVMDIFNEFKKGLAEEIDAEDSETHYNLGIAYKEMGLLDDAIKAFQTVSKDPAYFIQSVTMLGICYMEKGLYSLAVDAFTGALMKTDSDDESSWGLKYELAQAEEKNGNIKEAMQLFTEVYSWNATFRDVGDRLKQLKKAEELKNKQKEKKSRVSYI